MNAGLQFLKSIICNKEADIDYENFKGELDVKNNKIYFSFNGSIDADILFKGIEGTTTSPPQVGVVTPKPPVHTEPSYTPKTGNGEATVPKIPTIPPIPGGSGSNTVNKPSVPKYDNTTQTSAPPPPSVSTNVDADGIKDVQILAINTLLGVNEANYKEVAADAFKNAGIELETIPPLEGLTYKQAIEIIKYGNDKFKK